MTKLFGLFLLALACWAPNIAEAATCFWVGGTGTWSTSNTTSWASGTGGTGGTCAATGGIPKQATDIATFDANSGGGTVTVDATMNGVSMAGITAGAFASGTLTFAANNPSMTFSGVLSLTGTATRNINLGSGTFTFTTNGGNVIDCSTATNLTATFSNATFALTGNSGSSRLISPGGQTYGTVSIGTDTNRNGVTIFSSGTFGTFSLAAGSLLIINNGITLTVTNAPTFTGTSSSPIAIRTNTAGSLSTLSVATGTVSCVYCYLERNVGSGGATFSATNSFDGGGNTNWSFPAWTAGGGGGGRIIGG